MPTHRVRITKTNSLRGGGFRLQPLPAANAIKRAESRARQLRGSPRTKLRGFCLMPRINRAALRLKRGRTKIRPQLTSKDQSCAQLSSPFSLPLP